MALLPRRNPQNVPAEVSEYYQAEKRDRVGMAWLLSIVTFIATVVIVLGLFFGGRWGYRKFVSNRNPNPTASVKQEENKTPASSNSGSKPSTTQPKPASTPTPAPTPAPTPTPAPAASTPVPAPAPQPTPAPTPARSATTPTQVAAAPPATTVPNTGPSGTLMIMMVIAVGYVLHLGYTKTRRQNS
jgi:cytoskeletal protein RodZ